MNGKITKEELIKYLQNKNFDYAVIIDNILDRSGRIYSEPDKVLLSCELILKEN